MHYATFDIIRRDRVTVVGVKLTTTTLARADYIKRLRVAALDRQQSIRHFSGTAKRHPNDADNPFIGSLTALTRAVTDGVAAGKLTADEARQLVSAFCSEYYRIAANSTAAQALGYIS